MKVMIAEDDSATLQLLTAAAESMDHTVIPVSAGDTLVEEYGRCRPHVVFTDWELPGLDGPDAIAQIRVHPFGIYAYIVLLTGTRDIQGVSQALRSGADDYMLKPVDLARFKVALQIADVRMHESAGVKSVFRAAGGAG